MFRYDETNMVRPSAKLGVSESIYASKERERGDCTTSVLARLYERYPSCQGFGEIHIV